MRLSWIVVGLAALASPAAATDLNLSVEAGGGNAITVGPGDSVSWSVVGELGDSANEGLAFFVLDVQFDGGGLSAADSPSSSPMTSFDSPDGLTNPAGFGGTLDGGDLIQVGGAQNTINNSFAAVPVGAVTTGVAQPGFAEALVSGTLTAPIDPGTYTLSVTNVMANVIRQGEIGVPFWAVDAADIGAVTNLTVEVSAFSVDVPTASIGGLGSQTMFLDAGDANAGRTYYILGTFSGTDPGITLANGTNIPLNYDEYFQLLVDLPNAIIAPQTGTLDFEGKATAVFTLPPGTPAILNGITFQHAYLLLSPKNFASNVVDVTLVP
jgi:hypothetical protein